MNWYLGLKEAVVVAPDRDETYLGIGHSRFNAEYDPTDDEMWFIDANWQFTSQKADNGDTHYDRYGTYRDMNDDDSEQVLPPYMARGRFSRNPTYPNGIISVLYSFVGEKYTRPAAYEFKQERVVSILEGHYGATVPIKEFDIGQ